MDFLTTMFGAGGALWTAVFFILAISIIGYSFIRINMNSPEDLIIGDWSEHSWKYERVATPQQKKDACVDSLSGALNSKSASSTIRKPQNSTLELDIADVKVATNPI